MNRVPSPARGRNCRGALVVLAGVLALSGCESVRIERPSASSIQSPFTWIATDDTTAIARIAATPGSEDSLMLPGRRSVAARELTSWAPKIDPHKHLPELGFGVPDSALVAGVSVVLLPGRVAVSHSTYAENWHHSVSAFTKNDDDGFRLFIENRLADEFYEVRGIPLPQRPYDDLVWISDSILAFDRWSTPHTGVHYAIDVRNSVLLQANSFDDSNDSWRAPEIEPEDVRAGKQVDAASAD
jgi:hypothetical protein